jgi:LPXTG-site transpeptidase (sortase) family protein
LVLFTAGVSSILPLDAIAVAPPVQAAPADATPGSNAGPSAYEAVTPTRIADTRPDSGIGGFNDIAPRLIRVPVAGRAGVSEQASAVVVNITAVDSQGSGWVSAFPSGESIPLASSLNVDQAGRVISNLVTVRLGASGAIDIATNVDMHLVVDVVGAYTPHPAATSSGRLETPPGGAVRALDTRDQAAPLGVGETRTVDLGRAGVPVGASAVVVSLVATEAGVGFWTAFPSGVQRPLASSMNVDTPGQTRSAQAIIPLLPGSRSFQMFSQSGGHLVVDVAGWFTGDGAAVSTDGLFVPTSPTRVLDSRDDFRMAPWGATTLEFGTGSPFPLTTGAVALNITATEPWYLGYITVYPAGVERPWASNLNVTAFDQIVANHAIVRAGSRGLAVFTQSGTHLVADVAGWYLGTPEPSTLPQPYIESTDPTAALAVTAPQANIGTFIGTNRNINTNIDAGLAGLWMGSGQLGAVDHNVYFAHRTSHGGPFRNLDRMTVGTTFTMIGADGRTYRYLVTRQDVILPKPAELLKVVTAAGPITVTLVACHPPGKITYRLAVSGRLIGVVD